MNIPTELRTLTWLYLGKLKLGRSSQGDLDPETSEYLRQDNPNLVDLRGRYDRMKTPGHSCWSVWEPRVNLRLFRAEQTYLSQAYLTGSLDRYRLTTAYVEVLDEGRWLRSLPEDSKFGVKLWRVGEGLVVSRDLLDSIVELHWLKEALGWNVNDSMDILDIGAGYGRFAHRFVRAFPNGAVTCVDAIATSTFLCDFYLRYRGCERANVVAIDHLDKLRPGHFSLATNIHSWSESTLAWVRFWLDVVTDLGVPYLFVVPNFPDLRTRELDGSFGDFGPELERRGYRCILKTRKYHRSSVVDQRGVYPGDYYLFGR